MEMAVVLELAVIVIEWLSLSDVIAMERLSLSCSGCPRHGVDCHYMELTVIVMELTVIVMERLSVSWSGCHCHGVDWHCHGAAFIVMELAVIVMEQLSLSWSSSLSRKEQVQ